MSALAPLTGRPASFLPYAPYSKQGRTAQLGNRNNDLHLCLAVGVQISMSQNFPRLSSEQRAKGQGLFLVLCVCVSCPLLACEYEACPPPLLPSTRAGLLWRKRAADGQDEALDLIHSGMGREGVVVSRGVCVAGVRQGGRLFFLFVQHHHHIIIIHRVLLPGGGGRGLS